jgi:high-affinity nickel-transport protein
LVVGIVHGLAGSAAVALLVLSTIREPKWAVLYLLVFGLGTIAGMTVITSVIALPLSVAGTRFLWLNRGLVTGSGLVSLAFGLFICYQIGFVDGLFTAHPHWTPT